MPVGEAPHKAIEQDPGAQTRYELCLLAAREVEGLSVSRHEVDRDGPSYSIDTLRVMREKSPRDELFFIMGGDQARALRDWREPEEMLRLATVAVAARDSGSREQVTQAVAGLAGSERLRFFSMPRIEVSSSMVRERVAAGRPIDLFVPAAVADRIRHTGLYGSERKA
jgi:nicotinate-nucleotide adenylyltransferase